MEMRRVCSLYGELCAHHCLKSSDCSLLTSHALSLALTLFLYGAKIETEFWGPHQAVVGPRSITGPIAPQGPCLTPVPLQDPLLLLALGFLLLQSHSPHNPAVCTPLLPCIVPPADIYLKGFINLSHRHHLVHNYELIQPVCISADLIFIIFQSSACVFCLTVGSMIRYVVQSTILRNRGNIYRHSMQILQLPD